MGCDIHAHVEQKVDGEWIHYSAPDVDRSYLLFGLLTGGVVGNRPSPDAVERVGVHDIRGLPKDISKPTQLSYNFWEGDAHSDSWVSGEELTRVVKEYTTYEGRRTYDAPFGYFHGNYFEDLPEFVEDVRLVFWFDN